MYSQFNIRSSVVKISLLCFCVFHFVPREPQTAFAVTINASDKAILYNWISTFKNITALYQIDWTTNDCVDIIRRGSLSALGCTATGHVSSIKILGEEVADDSAASSVAGVEISPQLANMPMLKSLTLQYLLLRGTIPNELFTTRYNWEVFNIKANRVWGTIPAAATQQRNLTEFMVDENLLDGIVPDFRGLPLLTTFFIRHNNFGCPQPNLIPAILTQGAFPSMARGACALDNNILSRPEDEPGTVCGLPAIHPDSICSLLPQAWLTRRFSDTPKFRVRPTGTHLSLEVDKNRHAIRLVRPNGTKLENPAFDVDFMFFSQYNLRDRYSSVAHKVLFLDAYDEMITDGDSGRIFRFRKRFNGTRGIVDTVWEFVGKSSVKFSLDLQNWDFPGDTDRFAFDVQMSWIAPFIDYKRPASCVQRSWENRAGATLTDNSVLINCTGTGTGIVVRSAISFPEVALALNFTGIDSNAEMEIPLAYTRDSDGGDYLFPYGGNQLFAPIGKLSGMNYANQTGFRAEVLDRLSREDPLGKQQWVVVRTSMEMKKFRNAYYDPKVTLTSLFTDDVAVDPQVQTVDESAVNLGVAVGVPVAIVVVATVVGVVLAFTLSKSFRYKVAPFMFSKNSEADTLANVDEEESTPSTPSVWRAPTLPSKP